MGKRRFDLFNSVLAGKSTNTFLWPVRYHFV